MSQRFTIDGSTALEQHLEGVCDQVREGVLAIVAKHKLEGLVLAGGYGRGEGGVLRADQGDAPYNDIEFFVFIKGSTWLNDRRYRRALHNLGERLTPGAGIDVEFKILSLSKLRRSGPSMFFYDLLNGHRWLIGDDTLFAGCDHHLDAKRIPLHEATRLLFNRCSGLLFAKERLQRPTFTAADADFVGRNIAKAQLALGDVLLASHGQYHWSCQERHRRLQSLHGVTPPLLAHHQQGVTFKLRPHRSSGTRDHLNQIHAELSELARMLFLDIENLRLKARFLSAEEYAANTINKCPEHPWLKNILLNIRSASSGTINRYPREHLLNQLATMLWGNTPMTANAVASYEQLWARFN